MTIDQVYNLNVRRGQVEEKLELANFKFENIFKYIGEMGQLVVGMGNEL